MSKTCIFAKTDILSVLKILDKEYKNAYSLNTPRGTRLMKAYSKMSIIALTSWLEDGIDELADLAIEKLHEIKNQEKLTRMVDSVYGFNYENDFSKCLIMAYGAHGYEYIETHVGDPDISKLKSILGNFKKWRDDAAHSYAAVINCDPSRVIREMNNIFPILKKIESHARKYKNNYL